MQLRLAMGVGSDHPWAFQSTKSLSIVLIAHNHHYRIVGLFLLSIREMVELQCRDSSKTDRDNLVLIDAKCYSAHNSETLTNDTENWKAQSSGVGEDKGNNVGLSCCKAE